MRLARAEWGRLFARRFTRIMILVVLVIVGLVVLNVAINSHKPDAAARALAERQVARVHAEIDQARAECEAQQSGRGTGAPPAAPGGGTSAAPSGGVPAPTGGAAPSGGAAAPTGSAAPGAGVPAPGDTAPGPGKERFPPGFDCSQINSGAVDAEQYLPYAFNFHNTMPTLLRVLGMLLALLGFVVGASFVGAEWASGGMTNLLLWQPRRVRVLLIKLGTLLAGVAVTGAVLATGYVAVFYATAQARGVVGRLTPGFWTSLGLEGVRSIALGLAAAAAGFGLASLGRHTATALGAAVGWGLVGELGLRIVLQVVRVARPERFMLSSYFIAWLTKRATFVDYPRCDFASGPCGEPKQWSITMGDAGWVLAAIIVLVVGAAVIMMRRRDVT